MAIVCALCLAAGKTDAQTLYNIGDIYTFRDGSKGVVFYVDPNNPWRGTVVAMKDLSENYLSLWSGSYSATVFPFNQMVSVPDSFFRYSDTVTTYHGKYNTHQTHGV